MRGRIDSHAKYRELIAARLDKPLTRVELRTLTSHLKKCAACQTIEADYRSQRSLMRGLAQPIPPRDLWARTSAGLDREVARDFRAQKWRRHIARGTRTAGPSTAVLTAIAAVGVSAALALLQLAPVVGPVASVAAGPTPLRVNPYQIAMLGQSASDVAIYQLDVNQVCPASGTLDCVPNQHFVRTPISLPSGVRAGKVAMNSQGSQLAFVGNKSGKDVIAVVSIPQGNKGKNNSNDAQATDSPDGPAQIAAEKTKSPNGITGPELVATDPPVTDDDGDQPSAPPASAVPGLAVLSILDNVQSAGAPPDWSPSGDILAFSAMPDDGSTGPDVYIWSPGDAKATQITSDHGSFFASWSNNRIVISRITAGSTRPHDFVIDPTSLEQRSVSGPQLWLPTVNTQRTQAIGWFGQLDTSSLLPSLGSGALYLMDWASVDPWAPSAQEAGSTDESDNAGADASGQTSSPTPDQDSGDQQTPTPHASSGASAAPTASSSPSDTQAPNASNSISDPDSPDDGAPAQVPASLVPLEPDRDPGASPVVDWQARWSSDGQVLGVWIADSAGSSWGRLEVLAVDPSTKRISDGDPLLPMTMAKRGFSLGGSQVAWVGPLSSSSNDNLDGELRIRTWGSDGDGGLRLQAPEQEEVTPAS
ncbi:MAG TPA: zf-HC2 domain-containing protein [Candidatus Limnocylindrales bacterium]